MSKTKAVKKREDQLTNDAESMINLEEPYVVQCTLQGVAPILFHRYSTDSVEAKSKAAKGSAAKKSDDVESYYYRTDSGLVGIAGKCFAGALAEAGRSIQDPRSPRKSARDLIKAGITVLDIVAPLHGEHSTADFEDKQRVVVQRAAVTRTRPAMKEGWKVTFQLLVNLPEYISPQFLQDLIIRAGRLAGLCDYRPTYGRFNMVEFKVLELE